MSLPAAATNDDDGDDALSSYELLRARVLTGSARCGHVGRGVLLREGMAAWMARRPTCSPTVERTDSERRAAPLVMDTLRSGVVGVLACMAMATTKEMSP